MENVTLDRTTGKLEISTNVGHQIKLVLFRVDTT